MTRFLDVRTWPVGGPLAHRVAVSQGTTITDYKGYDEKALRRDVSGQHVLLVTHGFNTNRKDGIAHLANWESLILRQLPVGWVYIGILWPGDSIWLHGLDYPEEPKVADQAGKLLGPWLDDLLASAATVDFASHSLGARVILQIIRNMKRAPNHAVIMAGAINDDCLSQEFAAEADRIAEISVFASDSDDVLKLAFPMGNLVGGILDQGHPWLRAALGRTGPFTGSSAIATLQGPWQIPDIWNYGHHNYIDDNAPLAPVMSSGTEIPAQGSQKPTQQSDGSTTVGWQEAFSAAVTANRLLR